MASRATVASRRSPKHRITQLQRGPEVVERRNQQQYQYALDALGSIGDDQAILPAWREQGWLDQHTVAIIEIHGKPWLQVAVTNANRRAMAELLRRGTLVDSLTVPTRFHAQVPVQPTRCIARRSHSPSQGLRPEEASARSW